MTLLGLLAGWSGNRTALIVGAVVLALCVSGWVVANAYRKRAIKWYVRSQYWFDKSREHENDAAHWRCEAKWLQSAVTFSNELDQLDETVPLTDEVVNRVMAAVFPDSAWGKRAAKSPKEVA